MFTSGVPLSSISRPSRYATKLPGAFLITLTQYYDYTNTSEQYKWFEEVVSRVDREKWVWRAEHSHIFCFTPITQGNAHKPLTKIPPHRYPWLIVMHHVAMYNTLISHYVEGECFRKIWEPLFFQYGVDFVITGHAHGYERTVTIFNYTHNECGYVHAQVWNRARFGKGEG